MFNEVKRISNNNQGGWFEWDIHQVLPIVE